MNYLWIWGIISEVSKLIFQKVKGIHDSGTELCVALSLIYNGSMSQVYGVRVYIHFDM